MPAPIEICVEELDIENREAEEEERFIRCVALAGSQPGLALDRSGELRWMPESRAPYGLWVSGDDKLVLMREAAAGPIRVERGARWLDAPAGKPVILCDQDILEVSGRRLRVHVHGRTEAVYAPERLSRSSFSRMARAAAMAATLALGGAAAAGTGPAGSGKSAVTGGPDIIEVRNRPPDVSPSERVDCTITSQKVQKKGPLILKATCKSTAKLKKGTYGNIIDPKTNGSLKDGAVTIKEILGGKKIVVEASGLKKQIKGVKIVRFWVNRY